MPNTLKSRTIDPPRTFESSDSSRIDSISIVIPAFNEETRLPATLQTVLAFLHERHWRFCEVLVVDDGSTDRTAALAAAFQPANPNVLLFRNDRNRGKGYSVRRGILKARGDWILFTDADLSAPIAELDRLVEAAGRHDASVVFGSRALDSSLISVEQSALRRTAGRCFNLLVR